MLENEQQFEALGLNPNNAAVGRFFAYLRIYESRTAKRLLSLETGRRGTEFLDAEEGGLKL